MELILEYEDKVKKARAKFDEVKNESEDSQERLRATAECLQLESERIEQYKELWNHRRYYAVDFGTEEKVAFIEKLYSERPKALKLPAIAKLRAEMSSYYRT